MSLQQLKSQRFVNAKYNPPTGLGQFSLAYNPVHTPNEGLVEVSVKAYYKFLGPRGEGDEQVPKPATYQDWTTPEKDDFRVRSKKASKDTWSDKYKFVCTEPGYEGLTTRVNIKLEEVGHRNQADYILKLRKVDATHSKAWNAGCEHGLNPYEANFSIHAVESRADFNGQGVFNFKYKQLEDAIKSAGVSLLPMEHKEVAFSEATKKALRSFCSIADRVLGSTVTGLHCNVVGLSTELVGSSRALERGAAVAKSLEKYFPGGFFQEDRTPAGKKKAEEILRKAGVKPGKYSGAALYMTIPANSPRLAHTNYIIFPHEFGHMLGCPDEYFGVLCSDIKERMDLDTLSRTGIGTQEVKPPTNDDERRRQAQQQAFANQVKKAGVESPVFQLDKFTANAVEYKESRTFEDQRIKEIQQKHGFGSKEGAKFKSTFQPVVGMVGASSSIMFTGMDVMAAHYLPIWSCLGDLTKPFVKRSSWKIVPV